MTSYREAFIERLGFGVDAFQIAALDAYDRGHNVLVSAPTGSGKTLVANYAISVALRSGGRSFYTTPLKALSNQKFHELSDLFGSSSVGLLTGDTSINRDAPIVVMTTEVLRNMLLSDADRLSDLALVVMDEVHFLQDPYRGGVWEEVLILSPRSTRLVALSATVNNARFLGEWLTAIRGETEVVVERERPIQLHNHVALVRRGQSRVDLVELLDDKSISSEAKRIDGTMKATRKFRPGPQWKGGRSSAPPPPFVTPRRTALLEAIDEEDLGPTIYFIFSRAACDDAVRQCLRDGLRFTDREMKLAIREIASRRVVEFDDQDLQALGFPEFLDALENGIAAHHAGMVPAFREIVERCFVANLLGVVFATETLALGVNMPARSVVLERFFKYSDNGRNLLTSGEFQQMTGRAGRRGLDDEGHAIICFTNEASLGDVARVALSPAPDLHSSFRPTYNLTANLMYHFTEEQAVALIEQSFAQFESDRRPHAGRRSLKDLMRARVAVLDDLGYGNGWTLSSSGALLRSLYHENDLLLAEAWYAGLFNDLDEATFAGILSCFVFEGRRPTRQGAPTGTRKQRPRELRDRVGPERRGEIQSRFNDLMVLQKRIFESETTHGVHHAKDPNAGMARAVASWARGASLATALDVTDAELGTVSPGDFVRHVKQVADLCEQLGRLRQNAEVSVVAHAAQDRILRSVVAGSMGIHNLGS